MPVDEDRRARGGDGGLRRHPLAVDGHRPGAPVPQHHVEEDEVAVLHQATLGFSPGLRAWVESVSTTSIPGPVTGVSPARAARRAVRSWSRRATVASAAAVPHPRTATIIHTRSGTRAARPHSPCGAHGRGAAIVPTVLPSTASSRPPVIRRGPPPPPGGTPLRTRPPSVPP